MIPTHNQENVSNDLDPYCNMKILKHFYDRSLFFMMVRVCSAEISVMWQRPPLRCEGAEVGSHWLISILCFSYWPDNQGCSKH